MRVYLDVCCLNRLFDDQTQDRIRLEAEAVSLILARIKLGEFLWIGSEALMLEIERTPNLERRYRVKILTAEMNDVVSVDKNTISRAQQLEILGLNAFDALHVACAEDGKATILLTTDDRFLRLAYRLANQLNLWVENPLKWLEEKWV